MPTLTDMRKTFFAILVFVFLSHCALAASKAHVIAFGKWTTVKCSTGNELEKTSDLKVRGLFVDSRLKEYTSGPPHEVTDRLFVVRRAFRVNDSLPQETGSTARWVWQRGGWLIVDRLTGRVSQMTLSEFAVPGSELAWYRRLRCLLWVFG